MSPPLEGLTVVSLEQAVAAPFATRQLADLGARVIKVERPGAGDFARQYDESVLGQSSYFVWLNRTKESVTCDLKSPDGPEIVHRLLGEADVFVQNLAPGAARRLGLDADSLRARYPELIVCGITGFGSDGPWADHKAYDLLVQCEAGVASLTGDPAAPAKVGISVVDIAAGMYAFSGILTALLRRATGGGAASFEVSLFDAIAEWMGAPAYYTEYSGGQPARAGLAHATIAPYGPYRTRGGGVVVVAVQNDREWRSFCDTVLGDGTLASRFARNSDRVARRDQLDAVVSARLGQLDEPDAVALLERAGVAHARLNDVRGLVDHPVLGERDRWREVDTPNGPVRALRPPWTGLDTRMGPVPGVGQHTDRILTALGYDDERIEQLRRAGTI